MKMETIEVEKKRETEPYIEIQNINALMHRYQSVDAGKSKR